MTLVTSEPLLRHQERTYGSLWAARDAMAEDRSQLVVRSASPVASARCLVSESGRLSLFGYQAYVEAWVRLCKMLSQSTLELTMDLAKPRDTGDASRVRTSAAAAADVFNIVAGLWPERLSGLKLLVSPQSHTLWEVSRRRGFSSGAAWQLETLREELFEPCELRQARVEGLKAELDFWQPAWLEIGAASVHSGVRCVLKEHGSPRFLPAVWLVWEGDEPAGPSRQEAAAIGAVGGCPSLTGDKRALQRVVDLCVGSPWRGWLLDLGRRPVFPGAGDLPGQQALERIRRMLGCVSWQRTLASVWSDLQEQLHSQDRGVRDLVEEDLFLMLLRHSVRPGISSHLRTCLEAGAGRLIFPKERTDE